MRAKPQCVYVLPLVGVKRGSGLMWSKTNGLRAQTTTSPVVSEVWNIRVFTRTQKRRKKNPPTSCRVYCVLATLRSQVVRVEPVLPWPCVAGTCYWWPFLCGWVLGELVSWDIKLGYIDLIQIHEHKLRCWLVWLTRVNIRGLLTWWISKKWKYYFWHMFNESSELSLYFLLLALFHPVLAAEM